MSPQTTFDFNLAEAKQVSVSIIDELGRTVREVVNESMSAGNHKIAVPSADLANGKYFVVLRTDFYSQILKLIV